MFGGCVGEGLAAVCGHESGAQGTRVEMPRSPREIGTISDQSIRFPAHPPFFLSRCLTSRSCLMSNVSCQTQP